MSFILTCENCYDTIELAENLTECECGLCLGELIDERPQISGGELGVE